MQFADDSWSELLWSVSPYLPMPAGFETGGGTVMLGDVAVQLLSPELTLVQTCVDSEWSRGHRGMAWLSDVERLVNRGACDPGAASRLAHSAGLAAVVERRLAVYRAAYEGVDGGTWLAQCPASSTGSQRLRADIRAFGRGRPLLERSVGAGEFLADRWLLDSVRQVPGAAARRVWRRGQGDRTGH